MWWRQKNPCQSDVSVWECWWPFIAGTSLVMAEPEAHRDPLAMQRFFADYGITTAHFVPSMLAAFVASLTPETGGQLCSLQSRCSAAVKRCPTALCRGWEVLAHVPLHDLYGPTEAAVDVGWYPAYGEALAAVSGNSIDQLCGLEYRPAYP
ncbi:AMP-binding protein [Shigella flexneri]